MVILSEQSLYISAKQEQEQQQQLVLEAHQHQLQQQYRQQQQMEVTGNTVVDHSDRVGKDSDLKIGRSRDKE